MKKKLLLILALCQLVISGIGATLGGGNSETTLTLVWNDPSNTNTPIPKAPPRPLVITQDGHILTLPAQGNDHMLVLRDDTGTVVYTTFVPAGTTQIVLPSTLSGDFEIRLVADTYYYIGYILL